jgi:hypothetical protein
LAAFTKTISNSIVCLGNSPTTKWGSGVVYVMTWGSSKWGEGTETLLIAFDKTLSETLTITDSLGGKEVGKAITLGEVTTGFEDTSETLQDRNGYFYVFPKPTTDNENRYNPSYTSGSVAAASWTSQSISAVTWS